ncbi:hypothetical protein [Burkholderia mayonis]|uniref:hypothetical protein n=1 Tax=Burkholderia mayonis TaxID=1385591 RepID=UPI00131F08BF|nr:hypothetical protein [Burkholderia mayonis]
MNEQGDRAHAAAAAAAAAAAFKIAAKSNGQTAAAKTSNAAVRIVKLASPTASVAAASAMRGASCVHAPLYPTIDTLPRNAPTRSRRPLRRSIQAHRFIVAASLASRPRTLPLTRRARLLFVHSTTDIQSPFTPASIEISFKYYVFD